MPARHKTYRLTLTPATEAALLRLKECGENKQLLSRCALWGSSDALEAIIVLWKRRYPYQVGQDGEWGECILPGAWQAIEFDDAQWRAVAVMQGAWVRDWTQRGRRTDLTAQAEPLPAPPCVRRTSRSTAGRAPGRLVEEEASDDPAAHAARQQIPVESPAARLQRVVYEVYLQHGKVVLPGVVKAEIPGILLNGSGRGTSPHLPRERVRPPQPSPLFCTGRRIVCTLVPCYSLYLIQRFPTSVCLPLRSRRPPRAPARHPFCAATP